jgi:hypothetical protein
MAATKFSKNESISSLCMQIHRDLIFQGLRWFLPNTFSILFVIVGLPFITPRLKASSSFAIGTAIAL